MADPETLALLRRRLAALEGRGPGATASAAVVPLGLAAVDGQLPGGGLAAAALHEVFAAPGGPATAAAGFAALLLGRFSQTAGRPVVWCRRPAHAHRPALYGAGLRPLGLAPDRLVLAEAPDTQAILWCLEECLRSRAVAAVLGEIDRAADPRALRRLHLAAEDNAAAALLLWAGGDPALPGPAATRWRVAGAPSVTSGGGAWRLELLKCRGGGRPGTWEIAWESAWNGGSHDDGEAPQPAGGFRLVAAFPDGSADVRRTG